MARAEKSGRRRKAAVSGSLLGLLAVALLPSATAAPAQSSPGISPPLQAEVIDAPASVNEATRTVTYRIRLTSGPSAVRFGMQLDPPLFNQIEGSPWRRVLNIALDGNATLVEPAGSGVPSGMLCAQPPAFATPRRLVHGSRPPTRLLQLAMPGQSQAVLSVTYATDPRAVLWPRMLYRLTYTLLPPAEPGPPQPDWLSGALTLLSPIARVTGRTGVRVSLATHPPTPLPRLPITGNLAPALPTHDLGARRSIVVRARTRPRLRARSVVFTLWQVRHDAGVPRFHAVRRMHASTDRAGAAQVRLRLPGSGDYTVTARVRGEMRSTLPDFACPAHRFRVT